MKVGLAVVNGQLMAVGGFDGTTYLKTIEVYDPDANTWRYGARLSSSLMNDVIVYVSIRVSFHRLKIL